MSHRRFLLSTVLLAATLLGCLSTTTPQVFTPTPAAGQLLSEQSQVFFQKTGQQAEEVMVNDDRMSSTGDEIWTQAQGRALLRFPDLWVRIYDDTVLHTEEVTPSGIKLAMGSGAVLIGETPRSLEDVTIVLGSPPRARIILAGTLVMIAYIPSEQVVLVRAFDGKADVSVVATGRTARADSDSAEWLIVGPENQLETPSQDDVRALARRVGFWDLYHEIELDAAGFGPPGASIPAEHLAITFVGTPPPAASAQVCRPGVLYCEDFEDGEAQGWELRAGSQVEQEGVSKALAMSDFQGIDYLRDHSWQDHRFSLRFKLAQPTSHIVARYRYDADTESSYVIIFSSEIILLSKSGEGSGVFSSIKTPVTLGRWHQAEITGWGGRIQVTLDGEVVIDVLDQQPLQQGTIGLSPFLGDPHALVDDIEVLPAGPEPLQSPPPTKQPKLVVDAVKIASLAPTSSTTCPATFEVSADIYTNKAEGTVTYYWQYSDNISTEKETITFKGEDVKRVYAKRPFDGSFSGWVRLQIVEPDGSKYVQTDFQINCKPPKEQPKLVVDAVKIASLAPTSSTTCPATFEVSADIYTNKAGGTAVYYWQYSDNISTEKETITFKGEEVLRVYAKRPFDGSFSGWVRLQIVEPDGSKYDQTDFKITCEPPKLVVQDAKIISMSRTSGTVCPATYEVSADIYANKTEGQVAYYWQYSDNYSTDMEFVTFKGEDALRVYAKRDFGSSFSGWVRLQVAGPNEITSKVYYFQAPCEPPKLTVKDVEIGSIRRTSSTICPGIYEISAKVYTNQGAGSVTYYWQYNDNVYTDKITKTLNGQSVLTVTTQRKFLSLFTGWVRLRVTEPNSIDPSRSYFTITCKP